jgi:hypothetical protein
MQLTPHPRNPASICQMGIRELISAPARLVRYLVQPSLDAQARFDALSEDEKAESRYQSMRLNGVFQLFPSPFGPGRKRQPKT